MEQLDKRCWRDAELLHAGGVNEGKLSRRAGIESLMELFFTQISRRLFPLALKLTLLRYDLHTIKYTHLNYIFSDFWQVYTSVTITVKVQNIFNTSKKFLLVLLQSVSYPWHWLTFFHDRLVLAILEILIDGSIQ